jgi:hypothetical protein
MARLALGEGPQGIEERFKSIETLRDLLTETSKEKRENVPTRRP